MPITHTHEGDVAVLVLDHGRGNAINASFMDATRAALDDAKRAGARAVVLTGKGKVFSGGLDLLEIYDYDRAAMRAFVDAFEGFFRDVLAFALPTVAAINGHALAGGAILAMACDRRVMIDGPFAFGVNEVQIGIPFPAAAYEIARRATPAPARSAALLQGKRFTPVEAHAAGIVHAIAADPLAAALEEARAFAAAGADAVLDVKADLVAPVLARIDLTAEAKRERFLDRWFAPDARARVGALHRDLAARQKR
jgi:enoyl-CoA hydratase